MLIILIVQTLLLMDLQNINVLDMIFVDYLKLQQVVNLNHVMNINKWNIVINLINVYGITINVKIKINVNFNSIKPIANTLIIVTGTLLYVNKMFVIQPQLNNHVFQLFYKVATNVYGLIMFVKNSINVLKLRILYFLMIVISKIMDV